MSNKESKPRVEKMASRYAVSLEEAMTRQAEVEAESGTIIYGIRCITGGEFVVVVNGPVAKVTPLDETEPVCQGTFRFVKLKGAVTLRVDSTRRDVPLWSSARILNKYVLKDGGVEKT